MQGMNGAWFAATTPCTFSRSNAQAGISGMESYLAVSGLTSDWTGVERMAGSDASASLKGYDCRETRGCSSHIRSEVFNGGNSGPPLQQKWVFHGSEASSHKEVLNVVRCPHQNLSPEFELDLMAISSKVQERACLSSGCLLHSPCSASLPSEAAAVASQGTQSRYK